ncbi:MAG: radical SAM protein [Dehalococcoidales bacterium]
MSPAKVKDARYRLAREMGTVIKNWGGRLPIALIYPNAYYLGMSNLGMQSIYSLLNDYPNVVCERVFREKGDRTKKVLPLSLESQRPLTDFAVLAFSVTYELDYFNVPEILKASGIPIYAADRDESHPLVMAGGVCVTANPMPLSPFFDCLCIGEAESILPAMLPVLSEGISDKRDKLLKKISGVPGVYVPQSYDDTPVIRQFTQNLDDFPAHSVVLTPDTELGNLYLIEVERGCDWGCRFCLVSTAFSPTRFRSLDNLLSQGKEGLKYRKRLGLVGPAVSDHPQFEELLTGLQQMGAELSISSLRIKPLPTIALREMVKGGARSVALAPEAGSQRLRQVIRKNINEDDILKAMYLVAEQNIKQLKLYFMIGLPTETDDDIEEMVKLVLKCKAILDSRQSGCRITLSIAPFVPKAGTPFQWLPMEQLSTLKNRLSLLKKRLSPQGIQIKAESLAWSQVQGSLARGKSRLAEALADIEEFSLSGWQNAVDKCRLDINTYLYRKLDTTEKLPWSMLDSGINTRRLQLELARALNQS